MQEVLSPQKTSETYSIPVISPFFGAARESNPGPPHPKGTSTPRLSGRPVSAWRLYLSG